jgi:CelD/BcsL family acetyltransferase involved in cellulose biosynthesis
MAVSQSRRVEHHALTADDFIVNQVQDPAALPALAAAWDGLLDANHPGAPFRSSAWLIAWWHSFGDGKQLAIYTVTRHDELIGILPAYRVSTSPGHWRLRLLGDTDVDSDYLGPIARSADLASISRVLAATLVTTQCDLMLEGLDARDEFTVALTRQAVLIGASCFSWSLAPCPFVAIPSDHDFEGWIRQRPGRLGRRLAAGQRWAETQPGYRLEVAQDEASLDAAARTFWRLHHARWASVGGSDAVYDSRTENFHRESLRALGKLGWARIYLLSVHGEVCAGLYGFMHGDRFAFYQSGFDARWRRRSVGSIVIGAALRDAFANGLREFDFLRGEEPYKGLFATSRRHLVVLHIAAGTPARTLWTLHRLRRHVRLLLRRVVPKQVVVWARRKQRMRRSWSPETAAHYR